MTTHGRRIFITGVTGLVGKALATELVRRGDEVLGLTRDAEKGRTALAGLGGKVTVVAGDPSVPGPWQEAMLTANAVVHLAGENVFGKRWSEEQKERLWKSRVDSTKLIAETLAKAPSRPAVFISASAVGYYGAVREETCDESASPGGDFLARLSVAWEAAAKPAGALPGVRHVVVRIGVVLDRDEGALKTMLPPFKLGVGGPIGDGRQWMSWIHRTDLVAIFLRALDDEILAGVYNGVAPTPATNGDFSRELAHQLGRPCVMRVPKIALRAAFGEVAEVMAGGQRAVPTRLVSHGFRFTYPVCDVALRDLLV